MLVCGKLRVIENLHCSILYAVLPLHIERGFLYDWKIGFTMVVDDFLLYERYTQKYVVEVHLN